MLSFSNLRPLGASIRPSSLEGRNCLDILKKSGKSKWWPCFSSSLMKRVLYFMILVNHYRTCTYRIKTFIFPNTVNLNSSTLKKRKLLQLCKLRPAIETLLENLAIIEQLLIIKSGNYWTRLSSENNRSNFQMWATVHTSTDRLNNYF